MRINGTNIDEWLFEYFEGNLSAGETKQLKQFLRSNKEHHVDYEAWKRSYITTPGVNYTIMDNMIKGGVSSGWFRWGIAVFTGLLLAGGAWWMSDMPAEINAVTAKNDTPIKIQNEAYDHSQLNKSQQNPDHSQLVQEIQFANVEKDQKKNTSTISRITATTDKKDNERSYLQKSEGGHSNDPTNVITSSSFYSKTSYRISGRSNKEDDVYGEDLLAQNTSGVTESGVLDRNDFLFDFLNEKKADTALMDDMLASAIEIDESNVEEGKEQRKSPKLNLRKLLDQKLGFINLHDPVILYGNMNPIMFNAAFTGGLQKGRMQGIYSNRWNGYGSQQMDSYNFSYDHYLPSFSGAFGIAYQSNSYGDGLFTSSQFDFIYSHKLKIKRGVSLEPAVRLSYGEHNLNKNKSYISDKELELRSNTIYMIDGSSFDTRVTENSYTDMGISMVMNGEAYYAGLSVDHLLQPEENVFGDQEMDGQKPVRYTFLVGTDYQRKQRSFMTFSPQVLFVHQGEESEAWFNGILRYKCLMAGAGYATSNEMKFLAGIQSARLQFMYSYDLTESALYNDVLPSHQLSFRMLFSKGKRKWDEIQIK